MPLALPLHMLALLYVRRPPCGNAAPKRRTNRPLDLCALPRYLKRDMGFETLDCEARADWRSFR